MSDCCTATNPDLIGVVTIDRRCGRRAVVKGILAVGGGLAMSACRPASEGEGVAARVRLAFCGQLLCVIPYEVARARGRFKEQGLDVELVYTRGGNQAMQALVGGAVEYAGTSFDVALQAAANGAAIRRFASTGQLPLYALAVSPGRRDALTDVAALDGNTVGISGLGNADHTLLLFLLERAGVEAGGVRFAAVGTNIFEALRLGQVDAAMIQEPALSLIVAAGGRELVNFMDIDEARMHLGGPYEFMGVAVRAAERERRLPEMRRLATALAAGLADTRSLPASDIIAALPGALLAGSDTAQLRRIIERYRLSLYPERVTIDRESVRRVVAAQEIAGLLQPGRVSLETLLDVTFAEL